MRRTLRTCLHPLLILGCLLATIPGTADAHDPEKRITMTLFGDGGDVLRPDRDTGGDYVWYLGLDAGLTYSRFQDGPIYYLIPHPYVPEIPWFGNANEGSGIGYAVGATIDFPLSDMFGIVLKGSYHTRAGSFKETLEVGTPWFSERSVVDNRTDMTLDYLSFDLLGRINFGDTPFYGLVGVSYSSLSSNSVELEQTILEPDNMFYYEDAGGSIINMLRSGTTDGEIREFLDSRTDLKFGLGYWLALTGSLSLTPEVSVAIPLDDLIDSETVADGAIEQGLVNPDFNVITSFVTIGLRWHIR